MSKNYIVNCYTCQHNGQETCKGCRTLLVGEDEPYENWQLREDLETKDKKIADLEAKLAESEEKINMLEEHKFYADNINRAYADKCKNYEQQLAEKEKEIDARMMTFEKRCQEYYKSKEFTIEQLEKVKGKIQHNILFVNRDDYLNVIEEIDNQIKELKEMK